MYVFCFVLRLFLFFPNKGSFGICLGDFEVPSMSPGSEFYISARGSHVQNHSKPFCLCFGRGVSKRASQRKLRIRQDMSRKQALWVRKQNVSNGVSISVFGARIYPLVNVYITIENHHFIAG